MARPRDKEKMLQVTIKVKGDDWQRLKEYAERKGGSPAAHHVRVAIAEYLEKYDNPKT